MRQALALALLAACAHGPAGAGRAETTAEVVAAERAFAARAQVVDARDAFIESFAADAIGFSPTVGPAQPRFQASPPWGIDIRWRPADAGGASSGEMGWTTGPVEYRRAATDAEPFGWGWYTSVWLRQPDGAWKVLADVGIETPAPGAPIADWTADPRDAGTGRRAAPFATERLAKLEARLLERDRALAQGAGRSAKAFVAVVDQRTRFHRDGAQPHVGERDVMAALRDGGATYRWTPVAAKVAAAGDLGFTYGDGARSGAGAEGEQPFVYLAIWERRGDVWRLRTLVHSTPPPKR